MKKNEILSPMVHLLATVEEPLPLWFHFKQLHDFLSQFIHFGEFGQRIHPVGFLPIHCAHLNPHGSCSVSGQEHTPVLMINVF